MPIKLRDLTTIEEFRPSDAPEVLFRFRRIASSDSMRSFVATAGPKGETNWEAAFVQKVARGIVSVEGLADVDGKPLVWPEAMADRVTILEALPSDDWVFLLHAAITRSAREAAESGKG